MEFQFSYTADTFAASRACLAQRYRCRWLIKVFFNLVQRNFGSKERAKHMVNL